MSNTQVIKRKNLQKIYGRVCEGWQKEITNLILFQSGDNIEVSEELILRAFSQASNSQKVLIEKFFKIKDSSEAFDKIKDYKSFCKHFNIKELTIKDFEQFGDQAKRMFAFHKIKNFETYFNDGWKANWKDNNEQKWYPYYQGSSGLLVLVGSSCDCYYLESEAGFYKTKAISDFVGKTFINIYSDYNRI